MSQRALPAVAHLFIQTCLKPLSGSSGNTYCRGIGLQTAPLATIALTSVIPNCHSMAKLSCKTVGTIDNLSINNNSAANSCAQCNLYEVLHTLGGSIGHLSNCRSIGIVCNCNLNVVEMF